MFRADEHRFRCESGTFFGRAVVPEVCRTRAMSSSLPQSGGDSTSGGTGPRVKAPADGAVDSATGEEIGALLQELNERGQTLILVTHNPELAARYTQRVIALADGRIAPAAVVQR